MISGGVKDYPFGGEPSLKRAYLLALHDGITSRLIKEASLYDEEAVLIVYRVFSSFSRT